MQPRKTWGGGGGGANIISGDKLILIHIEIVVVVCSNCLLEGEIEI